MLAQCRRLHVGCDATHPNDKVLQVALKFAGKHWAVHLRKRRNVSPGAPHKDSFLRPRKSNHQSSSEAPPATHQVVHRLQVGWRQQVLASLLRTAGGPRDAAGLEVAGLIDVRHHLARVAGDGGDGRVRDEVLAVRLVPALRVALQQRELRRRYVLHIRNRCSANGACRCRISEIREVGGARGGWETRAS